MASWDAFGGLIEMPTPNRIAEMGLRYANWHTEEMDLAATKKNWPTGRGFERYYGFLGGETNQWHPDIVYDNHPMEQLVTPDEDYHLSKDLVDRSIRFVRDARQIAPDKPFFLYLAFGACHAPHHVRKEWADRYAGKLYANDELAAEGTMRTRPSWFGLGGGTLRIGYDTGEGVSEAYEAPLTFTGGRINNVTFNVSGEPYTVLEKEAGAVFSRQ